MKSPSLLSRLPTIITRTPVIIGVLLFALYLLGGFFAVPVLVRWQVEKQVPVQLGHAISVGTVRFNPLLFRFEVDDLALSDPEGKPMLAFKRLLIDFELRSVIDRAWTFAEARLEAPVVNFSFDKAGRHNFAALLERLPKSDPAKENEGLPRFIVQQLTLTDARLDFSDAFHANPLVAKVEPLVLQIENLSSLPGQSASYRLSARTANSEVIETSGELALSPMTSMTSKGRLMLSGLQVKTLVRSLPRLLSIDSPTGSVDLSARFDLAIDAGGTLSGIIDEADLDIATLSLSANGAASPLLAVETLSLKQGRVDLAAHDASLAGFRLAKGRVAVTFDNDGKLDWGKLMRATVTPAQPAAEVVAEHGNAVATVPAVPGAWRVAVTRAEISEIEFGFADATQALAFDVNALGFEAASSAEFGAAGTRFTLDQPKLLLTGTRLKSGADSLVVPDGLIAAGQIVGDISDARFDVAIKKPYVSFAELKAQHGADAVDLGKLVVNGERLSLARGQTSSGLDLRFDDVALKLTALGVIAQGASFDIARIAAATLGAKSLALVLPDGSPEQALDIKGDGLSMALSDTVLHSPTDAATEMLRVGQASVSGGALRLKDKVLTADSVALSNGAAKTWLDAEGRFNGLTLTREAAAAAAAAAPEKHAKLADATWRMGVKSTEVDAFALGFEDRRGPTPLALGLEAIRVRIADFATGVTTPMQVNLKAKVASGGEIEAQGTVRADNGMSDLQLKLTAVALAPVQPLLSEVAVLTVASGTVSSTGRLRYGDPAAGSRLAYKGSFAVDGLEIDEVEPKRPFVAWDTLATEDLLLTVEPNRLDIGELRLVQPAGRLIIAEDHSVNLTDVLKKTKDEAGAAQRKAGNEDEAAETTETTEVPADPFPVTIARVRVSQGVLEFADLSLRPQFGARMHELKGVITGLGTDPNRSAKVQLDARVDKYGSAKIRGQISVFRPEKLTDIEMTFRNLTMSSLSPYVVKFAGRTIKGGQLALDLQYKVKDSKLLGQNKIVLKQVKLGEKVDSPGAADLPLDLAIAVLSDSQGVIDIDLPVSGDLNDPEFGYSAVIAKAFGNLITGIITAPFRALGAFFGAGNDSQLDSIDFEPGSAVVDPPEREKLAAIARAMKGRPKLTLIVPPTQSAEVDAAALQSLAVRTGIVAHMGLKLAPGENPGPVDAANPRAQAAIEAVFSERYAPEVLAVVKQRALAGMPAKPAQAPPPAFYQGLLDRMIKEHTVSEETLAQLATRRGEAIVAEMTAADGVDSNRVKLGEARPASPTRSATDKAVTLQLELGVTK